MITVNFDEKKLFGGQQQPAENPDHGFLARLTAEAKPLVVVAGVPLPAREGRVVKILGDDAELLSKTAHVRRCGERLGQFYARVGLGASQIRTLSRAEIANFVNTVERNEKGWATEPRPQRIIFPTAPWR